ncbi:retropepsin-like domain-containing protein [Candidatus Woesearchaeota archaeon]|nr:retropepsin-like domain-containing protein [Candidatus Woesearchaeota archaeon]
MIAAHKIPYRSRIPGDPLRPLIPVEIDNVGTVLCILDSGADMTTMPMAIGERAGLNVKKLGIPRVSECAHGHEGESYEVPMKLIVFNESFFLPVNLVKDSKESDPALLGRRGFFDKFQIVFNEAENEVVLKRNTNT